MPLASGVSSFLHDVSKVLLQSLTEAPRLMGDLPEARAFDSHSLIKPEEPVALNLDQKLGHLYEDACATLLESTPRYELMGRGIQLQQAAGKTLGELDFLIRDHNTREIIHLELAVKFYLAVESDDGLLLPGPDARDNYDRKLEKMRTHQLALTQKHCDLLPAAHQNETITTQHLMHGCIFDHVNATRGAEAEYLNPRGRRGKWMHANECRKYFGADALLEIIPKALWPVPFNRLTSIALDSWNPTPDIDRCVMVRSGEDPTPYFIAPDGYPQHKG